MKRMKLMLAAVTLAIPVMGSVTPAGAVTAHQYSSQGQGAYVSSKERVGGYRHSYRHRGHYHRHGYRR